MKEFGLGFRHFFEATSFLAKHRLLYFYLIPLALSILFYVAITASVIVFSKYLSTLLLGKYIPEGGLEIEGFWSFLNVFSGDVIQGISAVMVGLVVLLLSARISKYVILIILSPMFAYLSELVEEKVTGKVYPFNLIQFAKDILRGVIIALRNLLIELSLIGLLTIAGLFAGPLAVLIVPLLWLISAYFYGFSMMDYTSERKRLSISQSIKFVRMHKVLAIANGSLYAVFDMIPIIGLTIAPINAVVGATTAIIELEGIDK